MSALLDEIIHLAEDGKQPLPDILRKCLRLGHELKNERLKLWSTQELNGYNCDKDQLPEYRTICGQAYGNFVGLAYTAPNHIIPPAVLEESHREYASKLYLGDAVSTYADLVRDSPSGVLKFPWPSNMVGYYQGVWEGFILHAAWQQLPPSAIVGMLDTVRNLTLKMALEIKDELGTAYADLHNVKPHEAKRIENIVINAVGSNVAVGNIDASNQTIVVGDRVSLDQALGKAGLDKSDLNELSEAILVDGGSKPGNKVSEWIQSKAGKVVAGGIKVGVDVGKHLLTEFLLRYSGLKT
jgi:hypothetical protein